MQASGTIIGPLGPLIDLVGERGPKITGLSIDAVVAEALTADGWWLDRSRSRNPIISFLKDCLPNAQEVLDSEVDDKYVWYLVAEQGTGSFSSSDTWNTLHPCPEEVFWHKVVWFTGRIPKHAFITWVAARNRMVTKDRLLGWGLTVPASCVLCSGHDESRQHLFLIAHTVIRYGIFLQLGCIWLLRRGLMMCCGG